MKFIKHFSPPHEHNKQFFVRVTSNSYSSQLSHIHNLFLEARKSYPDLEPNHVHIHLLGGMYRKGCIALDFLADTPPSDPSFTEMSHQRLDPTI